MGVQGGGTTQRARARPRDRGRVLGARGAGRRRRRVAARIRERLPGYGTDDFRRAYRFDADTRRVFRGALRQIGFGATDRP